MTTKRKWAKAIALGTAIVGVGYLAQADGIPGETPMYYSGTLEERGALANGERDVRIYLWDSETSIEAASRKCATEPLNKTVLSDGRFRIALTNECATAVKASPDLWVEVVVEGQRLGRTKLGAVPYALEAARAQEASGALKAAIEKPVARLGSKTYSLNATFCGATSARDGNITSGPLAGYAAAKALCESACSSPSAHMCTGDELLRYASMGGQLATQHWYASGVYSYSYGGQSAYEYEYHDCKGWTARSQRSLVWDIARPSSETCASFHPVACCD